MISWLLFLISHVACTTLSGSWSPMPVLRDNTDFWSEGKPDGGWFTTPIHVNLLSNGNVLITGWDREAETNCTGMTGRRKGVTWIFDPVAFASNPVSPYYINPISEDPKKTGDVLYCSGHTPLTNGSVFFTGGAKYENLGTSSELEYGLDYARIFSGGHISRIPDPMPIGPAWYPTNARLANGKILITGGLAAFKPNAHNMGLCTFNFDKYLSDENPWEIIANASEVTGLLGEQAYSPGLKDYTRIWPLAEPIFATPTSGNKTDPPLAHQIALMGYKGTTFLLNTDMNTPLEKRFFTPKNGQRPGDAGSADPGVAWDSTAAIIGTGELLTMGGNAASTQQAQRVDLHNVATDSWRSFDLNRARATPSSTLLPDGTVLFINGENSMIDQDSAAQNFSAIDPRIPQIFDPYTGEVRDLSPEPSPTPFRGYHSNAILLKDASILVGGGVYKYGGVGCEHPTLRILTPPYLQLPCLPSCRPTWSVDASSTFFLPESGRIRIPVSNPMNVRKTRGVALLARGSFTHSFGQNQRYIPLEIATQTSSTLEISLPGSSALILPGDYFLYLISEQGVPSLGLHTEVLTADEYLRRGVAAAQGSETPTSEDFNDMGLKIAVGVLAGVLLLSLVVVLLLVFKLRTVRAQPSLESGL